MTENSLLQPPLPHDPKQRRFWNAPDGSARALAVADAARCSDHFIVAVTHDTHGAQVLESDLRIFSGGQVDVLHFPDWETLPYDLFPPHPEIVSQRIAALYRLPGISRGVLVVPIATLMQRLAPRSFISGSSLVLQRGQALNLRAEQLRLQSSGYRAVPQVQEPGDFAVRGALLDIFPMGSVEPYRIELLDRNIDSIRGFDPETQRSTHKVDAVNLLPAREFPLTVESSTRFRDTLRERFPIDPRHCPIYQDMKEGATPAGIEYYLPLFFDQTETLFDYLPGATVFVQDESALDAADTFWQQACKRHDSRAHDIERPILPVAELYLPPERLRVPAVDEGYLQGVDYAGLAGFARELGAVILVPWRPGEFVIRGGTLAVARSPKPLDPDAAARVQRYFIFGMRRSPLQDVEYAIFQLVEVAVRALSPGVNDPFTAMACIDRLGAGIARLATRRAAPGEYRDADGAVRVRAKTLPFPGYVHAAFSQIRQHARGDVAVLGRLLQTLAALAPHLEGDIRRAALRDQAEMVKRAAQDAVPEGADLKRLLRLHEEALAALDPER